MNALRGKQPGLPEGVKNIAQQPKEYPVKSNERDHFNNICCRKRRAQQKIFIGKRIANGKATIFEMFKRGKIKNHRNDQMQRG